MKNKIVFFMPLIGTGGVEKNLFVFSKFLSKKTMFLYVLHQKNLSTSLIKKSILYYQKKVLKIVIGKDYIILFVYILCLTF